MRCKLNFYDKLDNNLTTSLSLEIDRNILHLLIPEPQWGDGLGEYTLDEDFYIFLEKDFY